MTVKIACIALDCADALTVSRFWSAALGRPLDPVASSDFATIGFNQRRDAAGWAAADELTWMFARVPEPKTSKNRMHLDLMAPDVEAEASRLVELGATRLANREEYGCTWILMTDPEGNEFDLARAR